MNRIIVALIVLLPVSALAQYRAPTNAYKVIQQVDRARMQGDSRGPTTTIRTGNTSTTTYRSGASMQTTYINNGVQTGVRSIFRGPSGAVINSGGGITTKTPTGSVTHTW